MSAADLYIYSTMEDIVGDSMDMASPFPGHVDDFEIDIDIMEDGASNVDNDLEVADASPGASQSHNFATSAASEDHFHDADMMDEAIEPELTEHQTFLQSDTNHNTDDAALYPNQTIYESEMIDEDYDEDIDAPVADSHEQQLALSTEQRVDPRTETADTSQQEQDLNGGLDEARTVEAVTGQDLPDDDETKIESNAKNDIEQTEDTGDTELDTLKQSAPAEIPSEHKKASPSEEPELGTANLDTEPAYPQLDVVTEESLHNVHNHDETTEAQKVVESQTGTSSPGRLTEHPIKVYYQDTEISLFPPREGDSSSTFLLEDPELFYHSFSKVFSSCRQVLGGDINEDEILVVEVEQLNIQLNEDVTSVSNVTLAQLVEIYLHLCSNEEIHQPEPLFLNLVTKPSLLTQVSLLRKAAEEGKGISEYYSWDNHDFEELHRQDNEAEFAEKEANSANSYPEHDTEEQPAQQHEGGGTTTSSNADATQIPTDVRQPTSTNDERAEMDGPGDKEDGPHALLHGHEGEENEENQSDLHGYSGDGSDTDDQRPGLVPGGLPLEETHVPEAQTDSSVTVTAESNNDLHSSREAFSTQHINEADDAELEAQATDKDYDQGRNPDEDYKEQDTHESERQRNYDEEFAGNLLENQQEHESPPQYSGPTPQLASNGTEYYEEQQFDDYLGAETKLETGYEGTNDTVEVTTPEIADDLLGVDEDFFKSPEKNLGESNSAADNRKEQLDEQGEHRELLDEPEQRPTDLQFGSDIYDEDDDGEIESGAPSDEYGGEDFDVDEGEHYEDEVEVAESGSAKRSREFEDDGDAIHVGSPDPKRSRPS